MTHCRNMENETPKQSDNAIEITVILNREFVLHVSHHQLMSIRYGMLMQSDFNNIRLIYYINITRLSFWRHNRGVAPKRNQLFNCFVGSGHSMLYWTRMASFFHRNFSFFHCKYFDILKWIFCECYNKSANNSKHKKIMVRSLSIIERKRKKPRSTIGFSFSTNKQTSNSLLLFVVHFCKAQNGRCFVLFVSPKLYLHTSQFVLERNESKGSLNHQTNR